MKPITGQSTRDRTLTFGLTLALTILLGAAAAVQAQGTSMFTNGLTSPAKIVTAGGASLLVTESGTNTPNSGRISLVNRTTGARRTFIDGLPSGITSPGGAPEVSGPSGIKLNGLKLYLSISAGDTSTQVTGGTIPNPAPSANNVKIGKFHK